MHDVLGHRLSLPATYAGALEYRPDAPAEELSRAAGVIRSSARQALEELREVISVLREDDQAPNTDVSPGQGSVRPQPSLADVPRLVDESLQTGTLVHLDNQLTDLSAVPSNIGRAAYRIVQEGLTNARKHAADLPVQVLLDGRAGTELVVEIRNPMPRHSLVGAVAEAGPEELAGEEGFEPSTF